MRRLVLLFISGSLRIAFMSALLYVGLTVALRYFLRAFRVVASLNDGGGGFTSAFLLTRAVRNAFPRLKIPSRFFGLNSKS